MTNSKSTKRALISSAFAILICFAMLIGTTFAWFTDTAKAAVSRIQSGTLDVALEMKNSEGDWVSAEGETLNFVKAPSAEAEEILWEPGVTYALPELRIVNKGNLALKYKIAIAGAKDATPENDKNDLMLLDVIDWTYEVGGTSYALESEKHLAAQKGDAESFDTFTVKGHMQETANNDYQGLSIEGIAITVYATQDTVESDSYGNQYDANAEYPTYPLGLTEGDFAGKVAVDNKGVFYDSFKAAMENVADNGAIYLKENSKVDFPTHLNVTKNVAIYGNGADFSGKDISIGTYAAPENTETTVNIYNAKNLVVWGQPVGTRADVWNVNFYNCTNENYNFLMYRGSETGTAKINLTMTNCSASGFHDSIVHTSADGSIVIKNCTFKDNCAPVNIAHKQTGTLTVSVENSKFINCGKVNLADDYFAPARFVNNSETGSLNVTLKNNKFTGTVGTNGDILLGDYRPGKASHKVAAKIETANPVMVKSSEEPAYSYAGGTIVIPVVEAASQDELISVVKNNEIGSVKLGAGEYTLYNVNTKKTTNTSLVVEGAGKDSTVFTAGDMTVTDANGEGSSDYSYEGSTVTFKNMTVSVGTGNYKGFVRAKSLNFVNCKIVGRGSYWGVGDVVFKNCEFADNADDYNLWTYAGASFTFEECTFNSTAGKFVNAYKEQHTESTKLSFVKCKFIGGTENKPAVCIKGWSSQAWNVIFDGCELTNCKTDATTGSNYYLFGDGIEKETKVTINNSVVWENGAKK